MDLIFLLIFGWGLTSTIVNGSIFDRIRNYFLVKHPLIGKLFSCVRCLGFWVGIFIFIPCFLLGTLNPFLSPNFPFWTNVIIIPIIQSNFGVLMESLLVYLLKGSKSNV